MKHGLFTLQMKQPIEAVDDEICAIYKEVNKISWFCYVSQSNEELLSYLKKHYWNYFTFRKREDLHVISVYQIHPISRQQFQYHPTFTIPLLY